MQRTKLTKIAPHNKDNDDLKRWRERQYKDLKPALNATLPNGQLAFNYKKIVSNAQIEYLIKDWPESLCDFELAVLCAYNDGLDMSQGGKVETVQLKDDQGYLLPEIKKFTLYI